MKRISQIGQCCLLPALILFSLNTAFAQHRPPVQDIVRITLLQLNDVYQMSPIDKGKAGGLARVATLHRQVREQSPNLFFCLAGDTISPSVASTIFKGQQMIAVWNAIGLDFASLGNHEFDFGDDVLVERMRESKFTWLGSNVVDRKTGKTFNGMPRFVIREISGIRVGFFGLLTTDTTESSKPGSNIRFVDPILQARQIVRELKANGANLIIAITHLTMRKDKELAGTGLVDVILGGHEHELLQSMAGRTPIFKWGSDARQLGRIDVSVNRTTKKLIAVDWSAIPVTDAVKPDPSIEAIITEFEKRVSVALDAPIGRTAVDLDATSFSCRTKETNAGNFVADAFRTSTGADVAIVNGGSIRIDKLIPAGMLTRRDSLSMLPFENPIIKLEVTGATLKAALENGVSLSVGATASGRFPHVSGMKFEFNEKNPMGSRVSNIRIGNQALDQKRNYSIALAAFLADGGDGYTMFRGAKRLIDVEGAQIDSAIISNVVAKSGEISPAIEGRVIRIQ